jgi:hypothetical protein
MAIVGILLSIAIPNLAPRRQGYQRKQFVDHLNALLQAAWQNALVTNKLHRVNFDITKRIVSVEEQTDKKNAMGEPVFAPMGSRYLNSTYQWPENTFEVKNFFINNRDEFNLTLDSKGKGKIWFFIVPQGLAQPVIINLYDIKSTQSGKPLGFSLVLNPFLVQFKEYDEFQKPS